MEVVSLRLFIKEGQQKLFQREEVRQIRKIDERKITYFIEKNLFIGIIYHIRKYWEYYTWLSAIGLMRI